MILEVAILNVRDGTGAAFESAFREASSIIAAVPITNGSTSRLAAR